MTNPVSIKEQIEAKRAEVKKLLDQRKVLQIQAAQARQAKSMEVKAAREEKQKAIAVKKAISELRKADRAALQTSRTAAKAIRAEAVQAKLTARLEKVEARAKKLAAANAVRASVQRGLSKAKAKVKKPSEVTVIK